MTEGRKDGRTESGRREFLSFAALGVLSVLPSFRRLSVPVAQDSLAGSGPSGRLWDPSRAGRPVSPVTARDNDAGIQAIEKRLKCQCGTCNLDVYTCRTTDFACGTSPVMHQRVLALADAGLSAEEIVGEFVREHGQAILMAPPKRGFNLAGYFVPSVVIAVAAVMLTLVLRRWSRAAARAAPAAGPPGFPSAVAGSPAELEQLRSELERFPG